VQTILPCHGSSQPYIFWERRTALKPSILILATLAILLAAQCAFAEEREEQPPLSFKLSTGAYSKYLLEAGNLAYDGPVVQTDLTLFFNKPPIKGAYFNVWWSAGFDDSNLNSNYGDEVDYTVGWAGEVKGFTLDIGVSLFEMYRIGSLKGDIIHPYLEVGRPFHLSPQHTLTPFFKVTGVSFLPDEEGDRPDGALRMFLGAKHLWSITPGFSISQRAYVLHDEGACGRDSGFIGRYFAGFEKSIAKGLSFNAGITVSSPITHLDDDRKTEVVYGGGLVFRF